MNNISIKVYNHSTTPVETQYLAGYQYISNVLQFFPTAEGYVNNTVVSGINQYSYVYNYTDHLGNIRLSYKKNGTTLQILEENNYYPFGLKHTYYNTTNAQPNYKYKYQGQERQDELNLNWDSFKWRNYDYAIGRFMSVDPLAEKMRRHSPYNYAFDNPVYFIDPDGMAPSDWIKDNKTGKYEWRNEVTSISNTPTGYKYIGKENNDIVIDLFGKNSFSISDWDAGAISMEDFDNPYSARGAAFMNMIAETTMSVSLSADVSTQYDKKGNVSSKEFLGINTFVSISGNVVAPYPDMNLSIAKKEMTLQGNDINVYKPSPNGDIMQGGDVKTLAFETYWSAKSIQSNYGKSYNLDFKFKGQYNNNGHPMGYLGAAGFIPNPSNLNLSVKFRNLKPLTKTKLKYETKK